MVAGAYIELHEELGRGGQGVVLRGTLAFASGPRREVAVKRLMPSQDVVYAADAVGRLRDEATALAALNHPAIPDFVALSAVGDDLALITRYVDGHDLSWVLDQGAFLSPRAAVEVVIAVADALDAALSAPGPGGEVLALVHRDVKPSNIRVDARGHVWLLDFGLARSDRLARDAKTTRLGVVGSPSFIAPERVRGQRGTGAADVFSLGLVALELLGAPRALPEGWAPEGEVSLLSEDAWRERRAGRLQELWAAPEEVVALLEEMLAWMPERRPSAAAVRDRFGAMLGALEGSRLRDWAAALPQPARGVASPGVREPLRDLFTGEVAASGWAGRWRGVAAGAALGAAVASCGALAPTLLGVSVQDLTRSSDRVAAPSAVRSGAPAPFVVPKDPDGFATVDRVLGAHTPSDGISEAPLGGDGPSREVSGVSERASVMAEDAGETRPARGAPTTTAAIGAPNGSLAQSDPTPTAQQPPQVEQPPEDPPPTRWRSVSPQPIRLRRGDVIEGPGAVAPGRWTVEADFGEGFVEAGDVRLTSGAESTLACLPFLRLCELRP